MKRSLVAALLSALAPGLGQIYVGALTPGLRYTTVVLGLKLIGFISVAFGFLWSFEGVTVFYALTGFSLAAWVVSVVAAFAAARTAEEISARPYNKWWIYAVAILAFHGASQSIDIVRKSFYDILTLSSTAMIPTIYDGESLLLVREENPQAGSLVVFQREGAERDVRRLIGLPGDQVQLQDGKLFINGSPVPTKPLANVGVQSSGGRARTVAQDMETLPNGTSYGVLEDGQSGGDTTELFTVPPGQVFVLGDNRDHALDSRAYGFIPEAQITHVANIIVWSDELSRVGRSVR